MQKSQLEYAEFYITNVCNLTCEECNRFNNLQFRGHHKFDTVAYAKWANLVDITRITVLGGEPTYNPDLETFIEGISQLWPTSIKNITTNGTNLSMHKNLHQLCADYTWTVSIFLHSPELKSIIMTQIADTFGHCRPVKLNQDNGNDGLMLELESPLGVRVKIFHGGNFHKNAFKDKENFITYDSNPEKAHELCTMRGCHHFIDGRLYKCGVVALLPKILEQYKRPIDPLMLTYPGLDPDTVTREEIANLARAIPQCKFCSDEPNDWVQILNNSATLKKLKKKVIPIYNDI